MEATGMKTKKILYLNNYKGYTVYRRGVTYETVSIYILKYNRLINYKNVRKTIFHG